MFRMMSRILCLLTMKISSLLLLGFYFIISYSEGAIYAGHKVVRIYPNSEVDLTRVHHITKRSNNQVRYLDDEVPQGIVGQPAGNVDILTSSHGYDSLLDKLLKHGIKHDVLTNNLQRDLDQYMTDNARYREAHGSYFSSYHPHNEISEFLDDVVSRCNGRCRTMNIGRSFEGRPLKAIKITGSGPENKPKIWIDAGIHAREWISHATAQYVIERLVEEYETDEFVRNIVDMYEWHILPCVNPDGYNYTWETDRLWRKTRRPNPDTMCVGTDANRNFDYKWGVSGQVSSDPCANNYQGPHPFSEPETRAVADHILRHNGTWDVFITLHSKGQLIMAPWGYTKDKPEDYCDLAAVGNAMRKAIRETHGKTYRFGTASSILYMSSGTSRDWAKGGPRIKFTYTIELRDRGQYGWVLPPEQILPTGQEIWAALKAAMATIVG